jgi:uncharacterized protein
VSACLDASVVIPLFLADAFSPRAEALIAANAEILVSDWAAVEVSGVIARQVRIGAMSHRDALSTYADFDRWRANAASAETTPADVEAALKLVRRIDLGLRGPDALHIAIAMRLGAELATFDERMAEAARAVNVPVAG